MKQAFNALTQILNISITLEGFTFTIGTALLFFGIAGLLAFLIGGLFR